MSCVLSILFLAACPGEPAAAEEGITVLTPAVSGDQDILLVMEPQENKVITEFLFHFIRKFTLSSRAGNNHSATRGVSRC